MFEIERLRQCADVAGMGEFFFLIPRGSSRRLEFPKSGKAAFRLYRARGFCPLVGFGAEPQKQVFTRPGASRLPAEVRFFDLRVMHQLLAGAFKNYCAGFKNIGVVCHVKGRVCVLLNEQNGFSLGVDFGDD